MEDVISKKELLKATGISYGQLYRWKRELLIPEEWFMKQASSTGQETFFPRDKVLQRIKRILELKDSYSLEELAGMLSPEIVDRQFLEEELEQFEEIDIQVAAMFMDVLEKDIFRFREIIAMVAFTQVKQELQLDEDTMSELILHNAYHISSLKNLNMIMDVIAVEEHVYMIFANDNEQFYIDKRMVLKKRIQLQEVSNQMKEKYQSVFHFTLDGEGNSYEK